MRQFWRWSSRGNDDDDDDMMMKNERLMVYFCMHDVNVTLIRGFLVENFLTHARFTILFVVFCLYNKGISFDDKW